MALGPVGQIHISVTDIDISVAFYRDVLGIPLLFQVSGMPMAFFASGDVRLYLGVPESPEFRSKVVLYFTVTDIDAEYERLRDQHGLSFTGEPHGTGVSKTRLKQPLARNQAPRGFCPHLA